MMRSSPPLPIRMQEPPTPRPPHPLVRQKRKQRRRQKSAVFGYCELCEWKCGAEHRLSNTPSVFQPGINAAVAEHADVSQSLCAP